MSQTMPGALQSNDVGLVPLRPLIGRATELGRLGVLMAEGARLVTLWGPGGVGKTSLLHAFEEQARRTRSAVYCDATEARTDEDVQAAVARALRVNRGSGNTGDHSALVDSMRLRSPLLLLLDGFERVASISSGTVSAWLSEVPGLQVFVGSREPLNLAGEVRVHVEGLTTQSAVDLFRSLASAMGVALVDADTSTRIVARLDGLPLAIELAAARLDVLGARALADRLDHSLQVLGAARSSPLQATVEWSWTMLADEERLCLSHLSAFRGGFEPAIAEDMLSRLRVCANPLDVLASLRRKSLLHSCRSACASPARLALYEAVREFADGSLHASGQREAAYHAHAGALLDGTDRLVGQLHGFDQAEALEALAAEAENLMAVVERHARAEPELAARAALTLHPLLLVRGPFEPHLSLLDDLLNRAPHAVDARLEAKLLVARGEVLRVRGAVDRARQDLQRAMRLAQTCGDELTRLEGARLLGTVARMQGALDEALSLKRQATEGFEQLGERAREAIALGELGTVLASLGRLGEAARRHRAALDLHRAHGNRRYEGIELSYLGVALHRSGELRQALEVHQQALAIHREVGAVRSEAGDCCHLGYVLHQLARFDEARRHFQQALTLCEQVADRHLMAVVRTYLGDLECESGDGHAAHGLLTAALAFHERTGDRRLEAVTWLHLGYWHEAQHDEDRALAAFDSAIDRSAAVDRETRCLAHAHRAALLERRGETARAAESRLEAIQTPDNPLVRAAVEVLGIEGAHVTPAGQASSSSVRRALAMAGNARPARSILVGANWLWIEVDGNRLDLSRRASLRGVVRALVSHHEEGLRRTLTWEELFHDGWPDQKIKPEAALKRVYTAIWTLRKMGLSSVLLTVGDGYMLDPATVVRGRAT